MTANKIKTWLKEQRRSRALLADQLGVSAATVDGWLSAGRTIPGPSLKLISNLMNDNMTINPKLSLNDYAKAQRKADEAGLSLIEWIENLIICLRG